MKRSMHDAEGGGLRVEHGEAGMVLGGEHDITNPGQVRQPSPIQWMKLVRIEGFGQFVKEAVRIFPETPRPASG